MSFIRNLFSNHPSVIIEGYKKVLKDFYGRRYRDAYRRHEFAELTKEQREVWNNPPKPRQKLG